MSNADTARALPQLLGRIYGLCRRDFYERLNAHPRESVLETARSIEMTLDNRRRFFGQLLSLAGASTARGADLQRTQSDNTDQRQQSALQIRQSCAAFQAQQPDACHPTNGDETLAAYIGSFTKGLPHNQNGEVDSSAYQSLLQALSTGQITALEGIQRGSGAKFIDPLAAFAFQMEGADSHRLATDPPPAFSSPDAAGEMVELYWQALARDVPFADYGTSAVTQAAAQDLSTLSAFHGPKTSGKITTDTLFRGNITGGLQGPYVSQFFWQPVPVNSSILDQRYRLGASGIDYLTTYDEWFVLQTGVPPFREWTADSQARYIYNGRGLAEWVHYDFLYQAFHNAALIFLDQSPDTVLDTNPYLNPTTPYKTTKAQTGFATFGAPHIC